MFTWICPKCGSEVPPSENDCPNCRARAKASGEMAAQPVIEPPRAPVPSPVMSEPSPAATPFHAAAPVPKASSLSPALVALISAVVVVVLLAILYVFVLPKGSAGRTAAVALEKPGAPAAPNAHPLAKYIEVTGLRVMEGGAGKAKIAFVAVNHSPADLPELDAHLTLNGGGKAMFDFPVTIPSIGPYESKDIVTSVKTTLKAYELPDWQSLQPSLRIISEQ